MFSRTRFACLVPHSSAVGLLLILLGLTLTATLTFSQTIVPPGPVSGVWPDSGSPYLITGEITVPAGDSLTIAPGCSVIFQGHYKLIVNGWLLAVGEEGDSIVFTAANTSVGWWGIRFINAPDSSALLFCFVEHGHSGSDLGGGAYCNYSNPRMRNCTFFSNSGFMGGGLRCDHSSPTIISCNFIENYATDNGGGVDCWNYSNPLIESCLFVNNTSNNSGTVAGGGGIGANTSSPTIRNCTLYGNICNNGGGGGGIACEYSANTLIENCTIYGNTASDNGGGIYIYDQDASVINCDIFENQAANDGGGIYCTLANPIIDHNSIIENSGTWHGGGVCLRNNAHPTFQNNYISGNNSTNGGGIFCWDNSASNIYNNCIIGNSSGQSGGIGCWSNSNSTIVNNLIKGNSAVQGAALMFSGSNPTIKNCIISDNVGDYSINFNGCSGTSISYCDFLNNANANFGGGGVPSNLGVLSTTNANGDSCDQYCNIFLDPLFTNPDSDNYHLAYGSPCIDAGNPASQYNDPEDPWNLGYALWPSLGTITNDMGIYGGPETANWQEDSVDVGVYLILQPPEVVSFDTSLVPIALVYNAGDSTVTFPVSFEIGSFYADETFVTLYPGQMDTVSFESVHFQLYGTFTTSCETELVGDQNPDNDRQEGSVAVHNPGGGPEIYSVTPNYGGNTGNITVEISGMNFSDSADVKMTREGYPDIVGSPTLTDVVDSSLIRTRFDLNGKDIGQWNLVVTNPEGNFGIYYNGFTIEEGREGLWVNLIGPGQIPLTQQQNYIVTYGNNGNNDITPAYVFLKIPPNVECELISIVPSASPTDSTLLGILAVEPLHVNSNKALTIGITVPNPIGTFSIGVDITEDPSDHMPIELRGAYWDSTMSPPDIIKNKNYSIDEPDWIPPGDPTPIPTGYIHFFLGDQFAVCVGPGQVGYSYPYDPIINPDPEHDGGVATTSISLYLQTVKQGHPYYFDCGWFKPPGYTPETGQAAANYIINLSQQTTMFQQFDGPITPPGYDWAGSCLSLTMEALPSLENAGVSTRIVNGQECTMWYSPDVFEYILEVNGIECEFLQWAREEFPFFTWLSLWIESGFSCDPNDKYGPSGFGEGGFVPRHETFYYMIHFENDTSATAPAVDIWLQDTLDTNLDWATLEFDTSSHAPTSITLDSTLGLLTYYFDNIMLQPDSEGWVMFHIDPDTGLASGAQIQNWADIVFDYNDPVCTDTILNTIDALPPSSRMDSLPPESYPNFLVDWGGQDDSLGSGIGSYTIYVSVNGGLFAPWLANTTDTSAAYPGVVDSSYAFCCLARDHVGHQEVKPLEAETGTLVIPLGVVGPNEAKLPTEFAVGPVFPNPFNAELIIPLELPERSHLTIDLYNIRGQHVVTVFEGIRNAGYPKIRYQAEGLASGVYLYRVSAIGLEHGKTFHQVDKTVLLK